MNEQMLINAQEQRLQDVCCDLQNQVELLTEENNRLKAKLVNVQNELAELKQIRSYLEDQLHR